MSQGELAAASVKSYLANDYHSLKGMSSAGSALIASHLIQRQTRDGIAGPIAEIGAYEGRFFVALALSATPTDVLVAIDTFKWPDEGVKERFLANCARFGIAKERITLHKGDSAELSGNGLKALAGAPARFCHVDGDHTYDAGIHDLRIAYEAMSDDGVLCLDDMLHPMYPEPTVAVADFLKNHRDLVVFAVIDREPATIGVTKKKFLSAPKYLCCKRARLGYYQDVLREQVPDMLMTRMSAFSGNDALILIPA